MEPEHLRQQQRRHDAHLVEGTEGTALVDRRYLGEVDGCETGVEAAVDAEDETRDDEELIDVAEASDCHLAVGVLELRV